MNFPHKNYPYILLTVRFIISWLFQEYTCPGKRYEMGFTCIFLMDNMYLHVLWAVLAYS